MLLEEALDLSLAARSTPFVTMCLAAYARLAFAEGDPEQAARLEGAAEGLRRRVGLPAWPHLRRVEADLVAQVTPVRCGPTAGKPPPDQCSDRRVRVRVATVTRLRTVIDTGLRDRRRERPLCPVSRLGRSHLQAGPACQVHGDPTYLTAVRRAHSILNFLSLLAVRVARDERQEIVQRHGEITPGAALCIAVSVPP